ncbi:MAG: hypothetical protein JW712_08130 [Dehalococcoidales bacterium]|nr:hypothetical protein [Dehalococcoidales bacterium]
MIEYSQSGNVCIPGVVRNMMGNPWSFKQSVDMETIARNRGSGDPGKGPGPGPGRPSRDTSILVCTVLGVIAGCTIGVIIGGRLGGFGGIFLGLVAGLLVGGFAGVYTGDWLKKRKYRKIESRRGENKAENEKGPFIR